MVRVENLNAKWDRFEPDMVTAAIETDELLRDVDQALNEFDDDEAAMRREALGLPKLLKQVQGAGGLLSGVGLGVMQEPAALEAQ